MTEDRKTWRLMLAGVPVANQAAKVTYVDSCARILVKRHKPHFLIAPLSWVIRPRLERTVELEALGTYVYELCDGKRDVERIVDRFCARYSLTFHEARVLVTSFLRGLVERGVVVIVSPERS